VGELVGAKPYTVCEDLIPKIDAAWICTPPAHRTDIVLACAQAGKDIFAEKPLALALDDADRMVQAADDAGVLFMIGYVLRYMQPYKYLHEVLASGQLGELVNCWTRRYMPADMTTRWYGNQALSGGVLLDFGCHDIDQLYWHGGPVKTVFAHFDRVREGIQADEHAQALMTFVNGGMAATDVSWSSYLSESSLGITGTLGTVIMDGKSIVRQKLLGGEEEVVNVATADVGGAPDETEQEHFVRCIEEGIPPRTPAREARDVLAIVLAAQESGRTGQSVDL
jgi:predicted dehydrogenase